MPAYSAPVRDTICTARDAYFKNHGGSHKSRWFVPRVAEGLGRKRQVKVRAIQARPFASDVVANPPRRARAAATPGHSNPIDFIGRTSVAAGAYLYHRRGLLSNLLVFVDTPSISLPAAQTLCGKLPCSRVCCESVCPVNASSSVLRRALTIQHFLSVLTSFHQAGRIA